VSGGVYVCVCVWVGVGGCDIMHVCIITCQTTLSPHTLTHKTQKQHITTATKKQPAADQSQPPPLSLTHHTPQPPPKTPHTKKHTKKHTQQQPPRSSKPPRSRPSRGLAAPRAPPAGWRPPSSSPRHRDSSSTTPWRWRSGSASSRRPTRAGSTTRVGSCRRGPSEKRGGGGRGRGLWGFGFVPIQERGVGGWREKSTGTAHMKSRKKGWGGVGWGGRGETEQGGSKGKQDRGFVCCVVVVVGCAFSPPSVCPFFHP
jgi:hypothetical protein